MFHQEIYDLFMNMIVHQPSNFESSTSASERILKCEEGGDSAIWPLLFREFEGVNTFVGQS